jgi:hypothetical protein
VTATAKNAKRPPLGRPVTLSKPWQFKNVLSLNIETTVYVNKGEITMGDIRFVGPKSGKKGLTQVSVSNLQLHPFWYVENCPSCPGKKRQCVKPTATFTYHVKYPGFSYSYATAPMELGKVRADECSTP